MKILFLARLYRPHIGGVEQHLFEVCQFLKKNHRVTIVTEQYDASLAEYETVDGIEIWRIPLPKQHTSKFAIWHWWMKHLGLLFSADVIHIHDVFFWFLPFRWPFFWKRVFMTFHGYEPPGPPTFTQVFWHQLAALMTDGNICVGAFHEKWYGVVPTIVTYGGISEGTPPKVKKKQSKDSEIFFASRLAEDTGIMEYLHAAWVLHQKDFAFHLDVYGDGPLREECESFAWNHQLPIHFHGFVENAAQYISSHTIVFASQYLSILHALAEGKAVISFAHFEMKKDYLLMTPFANWITITYQPEQIAEAVIKHLPLVTAGTEWAQQQTWQKLEEQYQTLWQKK